jgi:methylglutamate dehydrogenase subunit C
MNAFRLPKGGCVDRSKPVSFTFDGKPFSGFEGDTLASALLANGVHFVGRSFKYHRPRGIYSAHAEEPNALVTIKEGRSAEPNALATTTWLKEGLIAESQNRWPSLDLDLLAINGLAAKFIPAGFYYKTFMWPAAFWEKLYEPAIRRAAGLGTLQATPDPNAYDKAHAFCDLLIIGAGPAGLTAALHAARAGLSVIIADQDRALGGRLLSETQSVNGQSGQVFARETEAALESFPRVRILRETAVFAAYDQMEFAAYERLDHPKAKGRVWRIIAKRALLAAGAVERPLVFSGNDTPGVMLASGLQTYASRFAVNPGAQVAFFTTSDSGWFAARDVAKAGINVAAVIDARADTKLDVQKLAGDIGARAILGGQVLKASGGKRLKTISGIDSNGAEFSFQVDALGLSGGWSPSVALGCHLGDRPLWRDDIHAFTLPTSVKHVTPIGAAAGLYRLSHALRSGTDAANAIAADFGFSASQTEQYSTDDNPCSLTPLWRVKDSISKAFVDLQNDVTIDDIELAAREGFRSVEHLKRYTTLGMGTDQGRTSNVNGLAIMAELLGTPIAASGVVLARPPAMPIPIGAFAGPHRDEHFRPERHTPSHEWAKERGAVFVEAGEWKRAQWYPLPDETDWLQSVVREAKAVRSAVGICDVSTFGKIDVQGPDAAKLLDHIYANTIGTLKPGRVRYGLMLREDGFAFDDGTVARLADDHFYVTTTTLNAGRVMQHLDFCRQVLWPELDVSAVSVTEHWAQFAIAGPNSRALLQRVLPLDLSKAAFPFMAVAQTHWNDVGVRLFRVSFSGELAFELAIPAQHADSFVRALFAAGEDFGLTPYGTETMSVLRIEKGHAAGGEFNGQTTAHDLGFGKLLATEKDYIGKTLAQRAALIDPMRPRLVGIRPAQHGMKIAGGAHLITPNVAPTAAADQGFVTASAYSPHLESYIGLALIKNGPERIGERLRYYDAVRGVDAIAEICAPVFIDPKGERQRG